MNPFSPLDLIAAHDWRRATFTTYSFSASFAEAVLVEALMRRGVTEITILTDPLGYRMALRERGAVRIGREYVVHPVSVRKGCFHPKLMVLEADDATHVTIGSGNLTFGGWSGNLECIEHLHPNGMSLAIGDVGRFFAALADADTCEHEAREYCRALAQRLDRASLKGRDDGRVRVVNSLEGPIIDGIVSTAGRLGGARTVTMASPYWDVRAVEQLSSSLGVGEVRAHVPPARVPAPKGMDWPRGSRIVRPVLVAQLATEEDSRRGLHAKVTEVTCADGRLVVSGSANATAAGLLLGGRAVRNVEVCVLRSDLGKGRGWSSAPVEPPPRPQTVIEDSEGDAAFGILVACHVDGAIHGRVLTPWRAHAADVTLDVNRRPIPIGTVAVLDGRFSVALGQLDDDELSLQGRIQIRIVAGEEVAEGFVTVPDFGTVRGRAGKDLSSMMATLRSMQTPEDVLALMEFVRVNPDVLRTKVAIKGRGYPGSGERSDPLVDPDRVGGPPIGEIPDPSKRGDEESGELAWRKFVARLLQAFGRTTAVTEDHEDETDRIEVARRRRTAKATDKLGLRFPQVFRTLSTGIDSDVQLMNLARMTCFVCATTGDPATGVYVARLVALATDLQLEPDARNSIGWCIAYLAAEGSVYDAASARSRMFLLGIDPDGILDQEYALPGFLEVIAPGADIDATLEAIRSTRTMHDDVRDLEKGLQIGVMPVELGALRRHEGWPRLQQQFAQEPARRRIRFVDRPVTACPMCNITLLPHLKSELARKGVCETTCHGFILARNA